MRHGIACPNKDRALAAACALRTHSELQGGMSNDAETRLLDLIADARHLADQLRLDWPRVLRLADVHYAAEDAHEDEACCEPVRYSHMHICTECSDEFSCDCDLECEPDESYCDYCNNPDE